MAEITVISKFRSARKRRKEMADWAERRYEAPAPAFVKREVLLRNGIPGATWVETGTFLGDTTELLARQAKKVISIEPEPMLYANALARFRGQDNVQICNGLSEEVMPAVLSTLSGDVCFWLDGHFSSGITHKGPKDTPIVDELAVIESALSRWGKVAVLIDDVRCFDPNHPEYSSYPSRNHLVQWANKNKLSWHIELDIFVARNFR